MPCLRGEHNPKHKLTTDEVLTIRASYIPGTIRMADLASHHHVSKQTISTILQGKTWSHLMEGISQ
jgi:hypothetical protein